MGIFYDAIEPYLPHHPQLLKEFKPPFFVMPHFKEKWRESQALKICFELSAVAYLGLRRVLDWGDFSDLQWQIRVLAKPPKNLSGRKELMISAIEARRIAMYRLLEPEVGKEGNYPPLTLCGVVGLGLLRMICPDNVRDASLRHDAIQVLMEKDPFADAVRRRFPDIFDGARTVEELIQDNNFQHLDPSQLQRLPPHVLRELYKKFNL